LLKCLNIKPVRMNVPSPGQHQFNPNKHNAVGTSFFAGGMTRVGERGPEDVYLPRGSAIQTAQASARARAAGSPDLHVTAPLVLKLDSREVWQGMLALKRNRGGVTLGLA
jgi:hypothetical protein